MERGPVLRIPWEWSPALGLRPVFTACMALHGSVVWFICWGLPREHNKSWTTAELSGLQGAIIGSQHSPVSPLFSSD